MGGRAGRRSGLRWVWAFLVLSGCGDDGVAIDPDLAPLVGDWNATELVIRSVFNPDLAPDLIELGATFDLNIQPSGQYTAILIYARQASTEIGTVVVAGNTVTLHREFPSRSTSTATYRLTGDVLTLEGDTEFDFNLDGTPEDAVSTMVLKRTP